MNPNTLADLSNLMREIDFAMLTTQTASGAMASRPMSNNGDVEYKGDSYFFTYDKARMVSDIERRPSVGLAFSGARGLIEKTPVFIAVEGEAELIRDKQRFEQHWNADLDRWFEQGIETPGLVLIRVHASRIKYWDGEENGEVALN